MKQEASYYSAEAFFVLRTPAYPISKLMQLNETLATHGQAVFQDLLTEFFRHPEAQEAIYLASPSLYDELIKYLNSQDFDYKRQSRLMHSLYKYLIRMSTRCTPYGLFAGCSVGRIDEVTLIKLSGQRYKHSRLDMNVLAQIIDALLKDPIVRAQSSFYANDSLYTTKDTHRYVTYTLKNKQRSYRLSSVKRSYYIDEVLASAQTGKTIDELVELLLDQTDDFTQEEAANYIERMIKLQLLVSELTPVVTGEEELPILINQLAHQQGTASYLTALRTISQHLKNQSPAIDKYADVKSVVDRQFVQTSRKYLIQTDLYFRCKDNSIHGKSIDQTVANAEKLLRLSVRENVDRLESFRKKLNARFAEQEVPLTTALDSELGVGYDLHVNGVSDYMPLLSGVSVCDNQAPKVSWDQLTQLKYRKLRQASISQMHIVRITDEEIERIQAEPISPEELPDSMHLFGTFVANSAEAIDRGEYEFLLKTFSGPSAGNLIGRFCHGDENLSSKLKASTKNEQQKHPEKIYAEIVHLPQARIGNILLRPTLSDYEIPYLGRASVTKERQIPISDLVVSSQHGKVILRSERLGKEVVPRLTTAHNTLQGLPVYKFLCDMQYQGKVVRTSWQWGPFDKEPFLPRVMYKNIIVSRARWYLPREDYTSSPVGKESDLLSAFRKVRATLNMPRYVVLAVGDNELMLDLECSFAVKILREKWSKFNVVLYEFITTPDNCFVTGEKEKYTHEVVIPFKKGILKPEASISKKVVHSVGVRRSFSTGSEWLYTKIYTGSRNADKILTEIIKPLATELINQDIIDQWFFIRYADPDQHLRVRFHNQYDKNFWKHILEELHQRLESYLREGIVYKIQTDTYQREIERYGSATIKLSEQLFFYDSEVVISFLDLIEGAKGEQYRWLFALRGVDELLNDFGYTTAQKDKLLKRLQQSFFEEHHGDDVLRHSLNDKYRADRTLIAEILDPKKDTDHIAPAVDLFRRRSLQNQAIVASIKEACLTEVGIPLANLLPSYIHMFLNRMFLSKPRLHELVTYHYLMKHYNSQVAREKHELGKGRLRTFKPQNDGSNVM